MKNKTIFFTGGGTGGHIYPGVAVANELKEKDCEVHFIGANRPLDKAILSRLDYPVHYLSIQPINTNHLIKKLYGLLFIPIALIQAFFLLIKYRPSIVMGFGGYASFPILYMAYLLKIKTAIWEANANPGLVSRMMAKKVNASFLNFPDEKKLFLKESTYVYGVPTRFQSKPQNKQSSFRVFIFGGSSGARSINEKVYALLKEVNQAGASDPLSAISYIHQIGSTDFQKFKDLYQNFNIDLEVKEFIHDMPEEMAKADLLICRAGASTIAEVSLSGKAAIFIPLPWAADNHQYENAKRLQEKGAAILMEQKDVSSASLRKEILSFVEDPAKKERIERHVNSFAKPNAASEVAEKILTFI